MLNIVALEGRIVTDIELKTTSTGTAVVSFRIAVQRSYVKQGEKRQSDFVTVVTWRNTAEFVYRHFVKGDMILISGRLESRNYEDKSGNKRSIVEVVANEISFCGEKTESSEKPLAQPETGIENETRHSNMTLEEIVVEDDLLF